MELVRCMNMKDPECDGAASGGFVAVDHSMIVVIDSSLGPAAAPFCTGCVCRLMNPVGGAEKVLVEASKIK